MPRDVAVMLPKPDTVEPLDTQCLSLGPVVMSHNVSSNVADIADQINVNSENVFYDTQLIPEVSVTSKPSMTVTVSQRVRRIGSDGGIEEMYGTDDSVSREYDVSDNVLRHDDTDVVCYRFLSAAHSEDSRVHEVPADSGVQVYAKTVENEPVVEHSVKEYEDVQEDGTVVHHRVTKTTQKTTVVQQVFIQGDEGTVDAGMTVSGPTIREYTDVRFSSPEEVQSNVEESEEVLDDGTVVRRTVATTSQQHLVTERHMVSGKVDAFDSGELPSGRDSDVGLAPVNGKQSPPSYIPELMKLSGTESDNTKEPGEHAHLFLIVFHLWGLSRMKIGSVMPQNVSDHLFGTL